MLKTSLSAVTVLSLACPGVALAAGSNGNSAVATPAIAAAQSVAPKAGEARTVTGVVVDAVDGLPVVGATVQVVGDPKSGTATDGDGNFSIRVKAGTKNPMLQITSVGYQKHLVPIEDMAILKVSLKPEGNTLNDVVVVGAGVQKKVSVTGSISQVKGEELKVSASTLTNNLAGKFAGVYANNTSGQPGTGAEFYIRGISNFAGKSATPLILLDDVEISAGDLNYVPAENIASFSVLKDASATAIYGARGANGVMIITTKGGDYNSKTNINVSVENAWNILGEMPKFVDGATYMEMYNKAQYYRTPAVAPRYSQDQIDRTREGVNPYLYPDVDWQQVLFRRSALRQRANVNLSGGGSKVKYYMSIEMNHEDGHLKTEKLYSWDNNIQNWNYTFQNNISYKVTPTTTLSMNMNAQIRQKASPETSATTLFNWCLQFNPVNFPVTFPAREGYDHILYGTYELAGNQFLPNPYAAMNTSYSQSNENTLNTVVKLNQELDFITQGLKFQGWVNFKSWGKKSFGRRITPYLYLAADGVAEGDYTDPIFTLRKAQDGARYINEDNALATQGDNTYEIQANLNWNRTFGEHELSAMTLYRMREYRGNTLLPNRNQGFSARATYDYGHRYLLEFNCGYNGTERLAKGYRFGFFPAASLGWVISNEKFWEPFADAVNTFKLRGSYGLVGSDNIVSAGGSYFLYFDKITNNDLNALAWQPGAGGSAGWGTSLGGPQISYYGVTDLGWEKVKKLDVGIDLRFYDRLSLTFDYFRDQRYDIFMQRQSWPKMLGYGDMMPYSAVGRVENQGIEGSASYNHRFNSELSASFTGNFTYNVNKLVNADELQYKYPWMGKTGLPINHTRGYIAEGLFKTQEEIDNSPEQLLGSQVKVGDIKYRDLNGDGVINQEDETMISEYGNTPRFQYGFGATLNYKKFDFGFFFTGSGKRKILLSGAMMSGVNNAFSPFQQTPGNAPRSVLSWVVENAFDPELGNFDAQYPLLGVNVGDVANNTVASTYWMRDGAFCRLRNVEIGYTFPLGRVYLSGINLLNITNFKLWDPELSAWYSYPLQKTVNVGIQLNL